MKKIPFGHTPDTELFYKTTTHSEALNVLLFSINSGEAFCKIIGEVGSGKTMLCRVLIRHLEKSRKLAYIPNPKLTVKSLYYTLAKELGVRIRSGSRDDQITQSIQNKLIKLNKLHGPVVLLIDEAQTMSDEVLETLRLFTNIETENQKLLQIVLFAQPELDSKLNKPHLRQLKQRITFSYRLKKLTSSQVLSYIRHRISSVSLEKNISVSFLTGLLVYYFSKGTPRLVNTLCHKALLLAYAKKQNTITSRNIFKAAKDTEGVDRFIIKNLKLFVAFGLFSASSTALAFWVGA